MDKQKTIDISESKETDALITNAATISAIRPWINPEFDRISLKGALGSGIGFNTDGGCNLS